MCSSYYENVTSGVNARMGAQLLVESCVFEGSGEAILSAGSSETGFATVRDVVFGNSTSTAPAGAMTIDDLPYPYDLLGSGDVKQSVVGKAGQTLQFSVYEDPILISL